MNCTEEMYEIDSGLSRRHFMLLMLQLVAFANLPACRKSISAFDGSTAVTPFIAEDHSQFLSRWAEQGIRDAVLINIDTHDDIVQVPDQKIRQLKEIYKRRDWQRFAAADELTTANRGLYGVANWIYAGGKLGIFKEVYWVIPFKLFSDPNNNAALHQLLTELNFKAEDIETFRLNNRQFKGYVNGIPFTLCELESLPSIESPLLLSIDVDFFPTYSNTHEASYLTSLYTLFSALYAKKYRFLDAAICYSINGEYLQPHLRWVGDAADQLFKNPQIIRNNTPTELLNLQQFVENAYRSLNADEILRQTEHYLEQHPDPSLLLYRAYAYMLQGDAENSYHTALESCRLDKRYCSGLMYIGTHFYIEKQYQTAVQFYQGGLAGDSEIKVGLFQYGNCLQKLGKFREALRVYEMDVKCNGSFPTEFMIVDTLIKLGDRPAAVQTFKAALRHLDEYSAPVVMSNTSAEALYRVLQFIEQNGLQDSAAEFRRRPMMQRMFRDFPQH